MHETVDQLDTDYRMYIVFSLSEIGPARAWDFLLTLQADANPFFLFVFLGRLHGSGITAICTGQQPKFVTLREDAARPTRCTTALCQGPFLRKSRNSTWLGPTPKSTAASTTIQSCCRQFRSSQLLAAAFWCVTNKTANATNLQQSRLFWPIFGLPVTSESIKLRPFHNWRFLPGFLP